MFDYRVRAKNLGAVGARNFRVSGHQRLVWEDCHYVDALMIFREGVLPQWEVRGKKNVWEDQTSTWQWFMRRWPTNLADRLKIIKSLDDFPGMYSWGISTGDAPVVAIWNLLNRVVAGVRSKQVNWNHEGSMVVTQSKLLGQTHHRNFSMSTEK